MLPPDRLALAISIQQTSYQLLQWVADAVRRGFIPATQAHQYASAGESAAAWIDEHFENLPTSLRPHPHFKREFAQFFGTYLVSSFEIVEQPGMRMVSPCGCYCPMCSYLVNAPHLRPKKLTKRDRQRALDLMAWRVAALAREEGLNTTEDTCRTIATQDETRRHAGYSTYGHWLIRRMDGETDGHSILALWREMAWTRAGSPIKKFELRFDDVVEAEKELVEVLKSQIAG
jgi:hypothetical protein